MALTELLRHRGLRPDGFLAHTLNPEPHTLNATTQTLNPILNTYLLELTTESCRSILAEMAKDEGASQM